MSRPLQRPPKILHGLDKNAIIKIPGDDNGGTTLPNPNRLRRATRQDIHGQTSALYSAKYHPMDDVMRPAAAKRYHGEAFGRDADTDDSEEATTDVDSDDEEDEENSPPVVRKWSTGIRHSSRALSQKPVDYNMKRHPQDAQLRLLDKAMIPSKSSTITSYKYTVHRPELLVSGDESSSEDEEAEENEEDAADEGLTPTKRYTVMHAIARRSVVIEDSDESSSDEEEPEDKEITPPAVRTKDVEGDVEDEGDYNKAGEETTAIQADGDDIVSETGNELPGSTSLPAGLPIIPTSEANNAILDELASSPGRDHRSAQNEQDAVTSESQADRATPPPSTFSRAPQGAFSITTNHLSGLSGVPSVHLYRSRSSPARRTTLAPVTTASSPSRGALLRPLLPPASTFIFGARPPTAPTATDARTFSFTLGRYINSSEPNNGTNSDTRATIIPPGSVLALAAAAAISNPFARTATAPSTNPFARTATAPSPSPFVRTVSAPVRSPFAPPSPSRAALTASNLHSEQPAPRFSIFGPRPTINPNSRFGMPSSPHYIVEPSVHSTPGSTKDGSAKEADDDETESETSSKVTPRVPRFPLSELDPRDIEGSRSKTPSSRSSSIRSNYPEGYIIPANPVVEPTEPAEPVAATIPAVVNPFGLATQTGPDGREVRLPAGFDHGTLFAPSFLHSSSFSAGQPHDMPPPIAHVPASTMGIVRPPGMLPPRRRPGRGPIQVRPDSPFHHVPDQDGEDYPDEGRYWEQENNDPLEFDNMYGMDTSEEEDETEPVKEEADENWPGNGTGGI